MFKLQAVSDQILYHTDGQLTRARSKWLPMDDFQAAKLTRRAEVDFVRGSHARPFLSSPPRSYCTAPRPLSPESYSTAAGAPYPSRTARLSLRRAKRAATTAQERPSRPQQAASRRHDRRSHRAFTQRSARGSLQPWGQPHHSSHHEARRHAARARSSSNEAESRRDGVKICRALPEERRERERGTAPIETR